MDSVKQKFFIENTHFSELKPTEVTLGDIEDVDEDQDEIWLMQCSKGTDLHKLKTHKLKLPGRTHVIDSLETVAVEFNRDNAITLGYCNRKGRYGLRKLPVRGGIIVRGNLRNKEPVTQERIEEQYTPMGRESLPQVRVRHPLLGARYENKLQLPEHVKERLKKANKMAAKESRKSIKVETIEIDDDDSNEIPTSKTKAKRKHQIKAEDAERGEASPHKKLKKSRKSTMEISEDLQWLKNI